MSTAEPESSIASYDVPKSSAGAYLRLLRPRQWTKNAIAYAPALFGAQLFHDDVFARATLCAIAFAIASSAIYIVNDLADRDRDRLHPTKRNRPLASGAVSVGAAMALVFLLASSSCVLAGMLGSGVLAVILAYIALMLAYSKWLKHLVLVDVFVIALGFVLRAVCGGIACSIKLSAWFLLCTIFGALFLSIEKRSHEVALLKHAAGEHRKSLSAYSPEFLSKLQSLITPGLVLCYALYTFHSPHGQSMLITVPFVLFAVMRYQYLSIHTELAGTPEDVLLKDLPMLACVMLWCLTCAAIIYKWLPSEWLAI